MVFLRARNMGRLARLKEVLKERCSLIASHFSKSPKQASRPWCFVYVSMLLFTIQALAGAYKWLSVRACTVAPAMGPRGFLHGPCASYQGAALMKATCLDPRWSLSKSYQAPLSSTIFKANLLPLPKECKQRALWQVWYDAMQWNEMGWDDAMS